MSKERAAKARRRLAAALTAGLGALALAVPAMAGSPKENNTYHAPPVHLGNNGGGFHMPGGGGGAHMPGNMGGGAHIPGSMGGGAHVPGGMGGGAHIPGGMAGGAHVPGSMHGGAHVPGGMQAGAHMPRETGMHAAGTHEASRGAEHHGTGMREGMAHGGGHEAGGHATNGAHGAGEHVAGTHGAGEHGGGHEAGTHEAGLHGGGTLRHEDMAHGMHADPRIGGDARLHTHFAAAGVGAHHEDRAFLHADAHRDIAADHAFVGLHAHDFHVRDVRAFTPREMGLWRHGLWRNEWHYGRRGWWWDVGGVWYPYADPIFPFPLVVAPLVAYDTPFVDGPDYTAMEVAPGAPGYVLPPPGAPGIPPLPAAPSGYYRCGDPAGYYPNVGACSAPWDLTDEPPPAQP